MEKYGTPHDMVEALKQLCGLTEQQALEKVASGEGPAMIKQAEARIRTQQEAAEPKE